MQSPYSHGKTSANWYNWKESHSEQLSVFESPALFTALNMILSLGIIAYIFAFELQTGVLPH